jgi:hypothetical protein
MHETDHACEHGVFTAHEHCSKCDPWPMTPSQRELARHALGFPNKKNTSYRNRFCAGMDHPAWGNWQNMVSEGYAIRRDGPLWGGDSMFYLTLKGALLARDAKEHLSPEDTAEMRKLEAM